jgi:hypothetical protein
MITGKRSLTVVFNAIDCIKIYAMAWTQIYGKDCAQKYKGFTKHMVLWRMNLYRRSNC